MDENELSAIAVDIAYRIHKELGPGLLESVYEEAFCYELHKLDIPHTRQQKVNVIYDGVIIGNGFRTDIIIDQKLLIEIKSVENFEKSIF